MISESLGIYKFKECTAHETHFVVLLVTCFFTALSDAKFTGRA